MDGEMFVEVRFENSEMFRTLLSLEYENNPEFGEWNADQIKNPSCFAYGLLEMMAQDDEYSGLFYRGHVSPIVSVWTWLKLDVESAEAQIDRLADFIMCEVPGEPSEGQGVIDTAIRLIRDHFAG